MRQRSCWADLPLIPSFSKEGIKGRSSPSLSVWFCFRGRGWRSSATISGAAAAKVGEVVDFGLDAVLDVAERPLLGDADILPRGLAGAFDLRQQAMRRFQALGEDGRQVVQSVRVGESQGEVEGVELEPESR